MQAEKRNAMGHRLRRIFERLPVEPGILIGLALIAGFALALGVIVDDVTENEAGAFDRTILMALRTAGNLAKPIGPGWLQGSVTDITALGSATVLTIVTTIAVAYLVVARRYRLALVTGLAIAGGSVFEKLLKLGFDRARPDVVPHLVTVHSLSFPSGHAMLSAITYLTLGTLLARAQTKRRLSVFVFCVGLLMALAIGLSRVYLGVHFPTDVLAGWCFGSLWVTLVWLIARVYTRRMDQPGSDR